MAPTGHDEESLREHVIETATRLFAALGYDATPITAVADACGVDVPAITAVMGDKQTLYRAVMDQMQTRQRAMLDAVTAEFIPDRAGLHRLADHVLDYCVAHPEHPSLWMHRWQSDAADIPELEGVYLQPELERFRGLLRRVTPPGADIDVDLAMQTITWTIRGFCVGGILNSRGEREGPENPVLLDRFRRHVHLLADQLFQPNR